MSESESEAEIGPMNAESGDDSDAQMISAIEKMKKKYGKKFEKQLRRINVIDETVNALTNLPFLHANISDKAGNMADCKMLFDTGSTCSLISKRFLDANCLVFTPIPYESTLQGFQGGTISCHCKGKFVIDIGVGEPTEVELIVIHSKC